MTKLDLVFERIRKLPADEQEALAVEIGWLLEDGDNKSVLTAEQWAEVEAALADRNEPTISHEDLFARLEADDK